jgi:nucleoside-diphosphate-sugar epimerase
MSNYGDRDIELVSGNLLSSEDCKKATAGVSMIIHLAAGNEKSFPGSFMNSVVTTRNLIESVRHEKTMKRFLNVSSFSVYSNMRIRRGGLLDESCELESSPMERSEAYCFGKVKQDELVTDLCNKYDIPFVIVRPGAVYGPGVRQLISPRVGTDPFGVFFHLGGRNRIPLTYIDNCAEAIVLAALTEGIDGEIFNIVDDNLPTSRQLIKLYKRNVGHFKSIYIPYRVFYTFCYLWEKYSKWSDAQLPPVFNRRKCAALWKGNRYSNSKLKELLHWRPKMDLDDGLRYYFDYLKENGGYK